ncbi:MAG: sigma-70 family RNA polymerase sigma factor [Bacteroidales bacterium]|jgi:RNA polymerase sigma-70 factor (ECF subfamily)|nr:sigma-70 family RNA polymerase sigma factor [Bacteroidales bacterium]
MMNLQELSDQALVEQFVAGDSKSFEVLIERHRNRLFSYIYYTVKNRHKAEDIFQETCIKAITSMLGGRYSEAGRFLPWMTRIAHNLIIDHFRQEKQLIICSSDGFAVSVLNSPKYSDATIEDDMVQDQIYADVRNLIDYLPDEQKEVILLRHYGDLSFKEIAEYTDVSINTALGRMRYALINLRRLIKENGIQVTASGK